MKKWTDIGNRMSDAPPTSCQGCHHTPIELAHKAIHEAIDIYTEYLIRNGLMKQEALSDDTYAFAIWAFINNVEHAFREIKK